MKWISQLVKGLFILLSAVVGIQIFMKTFEYYSPDLTHGFLKGKAEVFYSYYQYAFYIHILSAPIVLLAGLSQFSKLLRKKFLGLHKSLGYIYVLLILFFAAPSGLVMGFEAIGGFYTTLSFLFLTPLWWYFTFMAFKYAKSKNFYNHRLFMNRSMILTLSAVFLRIYAFIALWFFENTTIETYALISWLSWLPNLLIFELWHYLKPKSSAFLS